MRGELICSVLLVLGNAEADSIVYTVASKVAGVVGSVYPGCTEHGEATDEATDEEIEALTPVQRIERANYPAESHEVETEDGYILTVFRIPGRAGSVPVYLQHGLLESGLDWIIPGKNRSLAYILHDQGYDVWLGNARGNTYSKKHKTLSTSDPEFWNFTWSELGEYDLPAVITYIVNLKKSSLFYVGHSMGATTFSVMASLKPEMAKNVKVFIGLAPATYIYYAPGPIKYLAPLRKQFWHVASGLGINEFMGRGILWDNFARFFCKTHSIRSTLCSNALFLIAGFDPDQLDYSLLPYIWRSFPAGTSTKLFVHYLQQMAVNKVRRFDYGHTTNLKVYNSSVPPDYDLSSIKVPVAVFYSENDYLVGIKDVENFYYQVPNKLGMYKVQYKKFNHFDFLWGIDAPKLVYSKVLDIFSEFSNQIVRDY